MVELSAVDLDEMATALQDQTAYEYRWLIDAESIRARRRAIEWLVDSSLVDHQAAVCALARYADPDLP